MNKSKIEWTDYTFNFVSGCTKVSQGCKNCYAEKMHKRLRAMGQEAYNHPFSEVYYHYDKLHSGIMKLRGKTKPLKVFVNSMSDTFHQDITDGMINKFLDGAKYCEQHTFQLLTKRYKRLADFTSKYIIPDNVWLGISICDNTDLLMALPYLWEIRKNFKGVLFVSFEPLLEELDSKGIDSLICFVFDWIIVGGESGFNARPMNLDWVRKIRDLCIKYNKAFFFKQQSAYQNKDYKNNILDGVKWEQFPNT